MATVDALTSDAPSVEQAFASLSINASNGRRSHAVSERSTVAGLDEVVESLRELIGTLAPVNGLPCIIRIDSTRAGMFFRLAAVV